MHWPGTVRMMQHMLRSSLLLGLICLARVSLAQSFTNGGLEQGVTGWSFWTREKEAGSFQQDAQFKHSGQYSGLINHHGTEDWSLHPGSRVSVEPGQVYELSIAVNREGDGELSLCASLWDAESKVIDWSYGDRPASKTGGWQQLQARIFIPDGVTHMQPRILGHGTVKAWVDDFKMIQSSDPRFVRPRDLPQQLVINNKLIELAFTPSNGAFSVRDLRTGRDWTQHATTTAGMIDIGASKDRDSIRVKHVHGPSGLELSGVLKLEPNKPEVLFELSGAGAQADRLRYPHPFRSKPGDYLVIPMNEGISYPVEEQDIPLHRLIAFGGHGICMAFWGVTDGQAGHGVIIETPDDASIQMVRNDSLMGVAPEWEPQRGSLGYTRKLRYFFFDEGGHVAIAKRYRKHAQDTGLIKTLSEKRKQNENVDLLVGAVNIWCWDRDAVAIVRDLKAAGIERILWSNAQTPENLKALNDLGVLTSRYDIYQDVMNPEEFPKLSWIHSDWTTNAWPKDIILDAHRNWIKGWGVETKDGSMIHCGVICDKRAPDYARERIPAELKTHPYKSRFIDTTTAAPWHECFSPEHPMTRTESKQWKMKLLEYISKDSKLVTGCETGHDASVPFLHYFEGMLSLGPYRVPDAGRRMQVIWTNVPNNVARFQVGQKYRLPLWELVYHDCVVAQWYWGDYNNKLPAIWRKRDLFNVLYGTPPMFMFTRKLWEENRERFVESYRNTCPHVRKSGYSEMLEHRFLTKDRNVQQSRFASGQVVTVNFGTSPFTMADGTVLGPEGFSVVEK